MKKYETFTFGLPTPQHRRILEFIAKEEKTSQGKVLINLLESRVMQVLNKQASKKAHEELAMEFANELELNAVAWVGRDLRDWIDLAKTVGEEKAAKYKGRFMPLWEKYAHEID